MIVPHKGAVVIADRSVKVRLDANVEGFKAGMRTAATATQDFVKRSESYIEKHRASINDLSNTALGVGAGLLAGAGLAAKAAMDWESAWAGVQKTVDGTDQQMASLEQGLRDMTKVLPASHAEIAAVAEAAGQLGVGVGDVESFTRVMIDMGESTNLSAEEAATSLARFMNVMGTSMNDVGRLGATVVGLGNSFATTESEIVEMSQRLSGAGAQANLSEADVMGLAAAMSSVGIEAEAGGSAMSLTMKRIGKAVDEGGASLETFAMVSGMTVDEFSTMWESRPADALNAFVQGLSSVEEQGMTTNGVLSELGITGIRESDALLRLSAAGTLAADAMSQANTEFEDGTALIQEASKRYATAESQLAILRNTIVDVGIDIGGALAPVIGDTAQQLGFLVEKFQGLPDAAKSALGFGAGLAGVALLSVGAIGKTVVAVSDLRVALQNMGVQADLAGKKLKLLSIGSAVTLAITALASAVSFFVGAAAEAESRADSLAATFDELTGAATEATFQTLTDQLNEFLDAEKWKSLEEIGVSYQEMMDAITNGGEDAIAVRERLLQAVQTGTQAEKEAAQEALSALDKVGGAYQDTAAEAEYYAEKQHNVAGETKVSAEAQQILDDAVVELDGSIKNTNESLTEFLDLLFATGLATMSARDASAAYHESVAGVDAAVEEINAELGGMSEALNKNKTDFDLTTEAGRVANDAFQDIAKSGMDLTKAMAENGATQDELQANLDQTYNDLVTAAQGMGLSEDAANDLAREVLGIPDGVSIETWMDDEAERQAEATQRAIDNVDRSITVVTYFESRGVPGVKYNGGAGRPGGSTMTANADGNVWLGPGRIKKFANGSENHVAQIAGAGEMRLWAEPETGGEAYIPLAQSKRARSEQILADVAGRFGMTMSKFAEGGIRSPDYIPSMSPQSSSNGGVIFSPTFQNYNTDAVRATREQVAQFGHAIDSMAVVLA